MRKIIGKILRYFLDAVPKVYVIKKESILSNKERIRRLKR